jgi:hypothetical protein
MTAMSLPPPPGQPGPYGQPVDPGPAYGYPAPYGYPDAAGAQYPYPQPSPAPGYGYGYGYPQPPPARRSEPFVGCLLLVAGVLGVLGSVTPWATVHYLGVSIDVPGTDGDGKLTLAIAVVYAAMALLIVVGQGRLWVSIVALVFAGLNTLVALIDVGSINRLYGPVRALDLPDSAISTSYGIWLVVGGGGLGVAFSIVAMARRTAAGPAH